MKASEIKVGVIYAIDTDGGAPGRNSPGEGTRARALERVDETIVYGRREKMSGWRFEVLEPVRGYRSVDVGGTVPIPTRAVHAEWTAADDTVRRLRDETREDRERLYARCARFDVRRRRGWAEARSRALPQGPGVEIKANGDVTLERESFEHLLQLLESYVDREGRILPRG